MPKKQLCNYRPIHGELVPAAGWFAVLEVLPCRWCVVLGLDVCVCISVLCVQVAILYVHMYVQILNTHVCIW